MAKDARGHGSEKGGGGGIMSASQKRARDDAFLATQPNNSREAGTVRQGARYGSARADREAAASLAKGHPDGDKSAPVPVHGGMKPGMGWYGGADRAVANARNASNRGSVKWMAGNK